MDEIWISQYSTLDWRNHGLWKRYLRAAQEILGCTITHLDDKDPVRRRVSGPSLEGIGEFITKIGSQESSRWLFAKTSHRGISCHIKLDLEGTDFPSISVKWYFETKKANNILPYDSIVRLFAMGNSSLKSFYAYGDRLSYLKTKKKPSGSAIDVQEELPGVFWLTYFNSKYVEFFGPEKFSRLKKYVVETDGGIMLRLGETPDDCTKLDRICIETALGSKSFADPNRLIENAPGVHVLRFEDT